MNGYFIAAGVLSMALGIAHSLIGEKYFLPRLYKPVLPFHLGSELFINRTLRTAWHWISLAWFSVAILLFYLSFQMLSHVTRWICILIICWLLTSALLSFVFSRGRHLSWLVLVVIALLIYLGM